MQNNIPHYKKESFLKSLIAASSRVTRVNHHISGNRSINVSRDIYDIVSVHMHNWMNIGYLAGNKMISNNMSRRTHDGSRTMMHLRITS